MWLLTDNGFISIVEFDPPNVTITPAVYGLKEDGKTKDYTKIVEPAVRGTDKVCQEQIDQLVDYVPATTGNGGVLSSHLLVRARVEEDLGPLKKYDSKAVFFEDKTADYQFRCIISRLALSLYVASKVMAIDYNSHVKETVNRRAPQIPGGRMTALSSVWSAFSKWQPNSPYGAVTGSMYGHSYGSSDNKDWKSSSGSNSYYSGTKYGSYTKTLDKWLENKKDSSDEAKLDALTDEEWAAYGGAEWLDDDAPGADDPGWNMTDLEIRVASGDISEETMRLQLKEILLDVNAVGSVDMDNAIEHITDSFGTCDLGTIDEEALWSILDGITDDSFTLYEKEDENASTN